jgi:NADH-quinone oxidoreductase subunit L
LLGLFGKKYFKGTAGLAGTLSLLAATILSFSVAYNYFFVDGQVNGVYEKVIAFNYTWLHVFPECLDRYGRHR